MNVLAALARLAPDFVDHLPDADDVLLPELLPVLRAYEDAWFAVGETLHQDLPGVGTLLEAIERLPEPSLAAVQSSGVARVDAERWASWMAGAVGSVVAPSRWVQYVPGLSGATGLLVPQDGDPTLNLAVFQARSTEHRLIPLAVALAGQPPVIRNVTLYAPTGCDMDDDGDCVQETSVCGGSCGLAWVITQGAGDALACRCS